ncbi:hypothetical protein DFH11DRAFT_726229 [Phellopilus nigrolimitatus]|nr:hypothetical protein DFH11DRAFT_726229 [Phellopilus nigrolimitatus]
MFREGQLQVGRTVGARYTRTWEGSRGDHRETVIRACGDVHGRPTYSLDCALCAIHPKVSNREETVRAAMENKTARGRRRARNNPNLPYLALRCKPQTSLLIVVPRGPNNGDGTPWGRRTTRTRGQLYRTVGARYTRNMGGAAQRPSRNGHTRLRRRTRTSDMFVGLARPLACAVCAIHPKVSNFFDRDDKIEKRLFARPRRTRRREDVVEFAITQTGRILLSITV